MKHTLMGWKGIKISLCGIDVTDKFENGELILTDSYIERMKNSMPQVGQLRAKIDEIKALKK